MRSCGPSPIPVGSPAGGAAQDKKQKDFATVELMNASSVNAIDTVGRIRSLGPQIETAMAQLEEDSLSQDPDKNTFAAQQNKTNAIALVNTKQLMDANCWSRMPNCRSCGRSRSTMRRPRPLLPMAPCVRMARRHYRRNTVAPASR
jgi:hypothetical protein